ncbi:SpoIIE family protein phosphatase [Deltaproteobacteria bacterium TL4]
MLKSTSIENQKAPLLKVLLVDDDESLYLIVRKMLGKNRNRFKLDWEGTYDSAIQAIMDFRHDVYLIDYYLGDGVTGIEIIRESIARGCKAPMILLTANEDMDVDVKAMETGATDYLVKREINTVLLERAIRYAIRQKKIEIELDTKNQELDAINEDLKESLLMQTELNNHLIQATTNLTQAQTQIEQELAQARITQLSLLPHLKTKLASVRLASKYMPMDQLGGDLYDFLDFREEKVGIFIADVTGHGVEAALLTFLVSGLFKTFAPGVHSPTIALKKLNEALLKKIQGNKFVTAAYCIYDAKTQTLKFSSAGHPEGYLLRHKTQELLPLKTGGTILGSFEDMPLFEDLSLSLFPGDKVLMYTDGILETTNPHGEMFGKKRLKEALKAHSDLPMAELIETLYLRILTHMGNPQMKLNDDITLVGFEINDEL